jgi:hypothetical protein
MGGIRQSVGLEQGLVLNLPAERALAPTTSIMSKKCLMESLVVCSKISQVEMRVFNMRF